MVVPHLDLSVLGTRCVSLYSASFVYSNATLSWELGHSRWVVRMLDQIQRPWNGTQCKEAYITEVQAGGALEVLKTEIVTKAIDTIMDHHQAAHMDRGDGRNGIVHT
jgi:hypothetical protein